MGKPAKYRFEVLTDVDLDGAAMQVGLHHYAIGPARPGFLINTGAVEISVNVHGVADLDEMIAALRGAKRRLTKMEAS